MLQQPELVHQVYKLTSPRPQPEPPSSLPVPPLVPPTTPSLSTIALENFLKCRSHPVTPNSDSVVPRRTSSKFQTVARFGYSDLSALTHLLFPRHQAPASWILHLTLLLPRAPSSALQTLTFAEASLPPIVNEAVPSRSLKPDLSLLAFHRPERSFLRLGGFPLPLLIPLWGRDPALSTARAPSTAGC